MSGTAYYNEHDPRTVAWLRELIAEGHIAPGVVDERSITDIHAHELHGFTQRHFFAGIGGWSLALRLAGWPDDAPVDTGSCPCQPFSHAGQGRGHRDPRHLWPVWRPLLAECGAATVFGEQVASKAGRGWLGRVRADLEALGYAVGAADLCAAGAGEDAEGWILRGGASPLPGGEGARWERVVLGAPHIRQRLFWVAQSQHAQRRPLGGRGENELDRRDDRRAQAHREFGARGEVRRLGLAYGAGPQPGRPAAAPVGHGRSPEPAGDVGGVDYRREQRQPSVRDDHACDVGILVAADGFAGGPWSACDVLWCRDGKARRVESGTFPLAHGVPGRVGLLRGYGNAIVPQVAAAFIRSAAEAIAAAREERRCVA